MQETGMLQVGVQHIIEGGKDILFDFEDLWAEGLGMLVTCLSSVKVYLLDGEHEIPHATQESGFMMTWLRRLSTFGAGDWCC
ncbi:hypothetical protein DOTSEDRAFT_91277 [Dothistroma septosporum NZE10]|uniref:Uncharacterized protein n=1 Tax=Dothistroma septosporum (strain NZE10 / CBS 128990) TaxID=675120 RepID=N1PEC7_DOTSN|nr:hypothetical protein DOTSEDRAFT_91277 [Dothistroma septosporum NZE10]